MDIFLFKLQHREGKVILHHKQYLKQYVLIMGLGNECYLKYLSVKKALTRITFVIIIAVDTISELRRNDILGSIFFNSMNKIIKNK